MIRPSSSTGTKTETLREKIGSEVKKLRIEKNFSQEQLASLMGVSRTTISKIETGSFAISIDYLDFEIFIKPKGSRSKIIE